MIFHIIFTFLSEHIALAGWPSLLLMGWRASRFAAKFEQRIAKAEDTIELLATNHLPHLQQGIKDIEGAVERGFANLSNQLLILAGRATSVGCPVAKKDE